MLINGSTALRVWPGTPAVKTVELEPPAASQEQDAMKKPTSATEADVYVKSSSYMSHTRPIHFQQSKSILSRKKPRWQDFPDSEEVAGYRNVEFKGFKHLLLIVLAVGNMRLFFSDMNQFGFLNVLKQLGVVPDDIKYGVLICASNLLYFPVALTIECAMAYCAKQWKESRRQKIKSGSTPRTGSGSLFHPKRWWRAIAFLHILNATVLITLSSYLTRQLVWHPLIGTMVEANTIVVFLKLSSYALTNRDLRDSYISDKPVPDLYKDAPYPENLTFSNLNYFWFAPTLVYQPVYPRTPHIRWSVVLGLVVEILLSLAFMWLLVMQAAAPILEHTLTHYQAGDYTSLVDDFLSLVTFNIITWLLMFFVIFQCSLNLIAEITQFADREFYGAWWNAGCVGTYWRDWNKPVTNYFRRHIYVPLRKRGWNATACSTFVFFLSAVLHELLVGVPTRNFNGVAFFCMMAQVPLIMVTAPLEKMRGPGTTIGNCIFWLSIFLGQPTGVIIYYLAWNLRYGQPIAS